MNALHHFQDLPLRRKLTLLLLVPCVVVLLLAGSLLVWIQLTTFRRSFERDLLAVADIVAHNSTAAITFRDEASGTEMLNALRAKPHIVAAALVTPDRKVFARYGGLSNDWLPSGTPGQPRVVFQHKHAMVAQPVMLDGRQIAVLYVVSDFRSVYRSLLNVILCTLALMALVVVFVAVLLSRRLQRFVSDPVMRLADTARQITDHADYTVRAHQEGGVEFGILTRVFNQMLGRIESQDRALQSASQELARRVQELEHEIAERLKAEQKLTELHKELVVASHRAGMAEVASSVLHNVGNVLNSVNVSTGVIRDRLSRSQGHRLERLSEILVAKGAGLGVYLTDDPKGRLVPDYLVKVSQGLAEERSDLCVEVQTLTKNVEHIKQIVATQQNYARMGGMIEDLPIETLVEDAVQINAGALRRQSIALERQFGPVPLVRVDKHKVLQILVNLLQNARHALDASGSTNKKLSLTIGLNGSGRVQVVVQDNGVGIAAENMQRIFQHGFTTKKDGHGFGLHSGAIAAKEMGGTLEVTSDGPGKGARFTLGLPIASAQEQMAASPKQQVPQ